MKNIEKVIELVDIVIDESIDDIDGLYLHAIEKQVST